MRGESALVLFLVCCCFSWGVVVAMNTAPVMLWSNSIEVLKSGSEHHSTHPAPLTAHGLAALIHVITATSSPQASDGWASYVPSAIPEVVVFYVKSALSSASFARLANGGALSFLQSVTSSASQSSVVFSHGQDGLYGTVATQVAERVLQRYASAKVVATGNSRVAPLAGGAAATTVVPIAQLAQHLQTSGVYTNGVPDVVVVYMHGAELSDAEQNAWMAQLDGAIRQGTSGKYLAVFGGDRFPESSSLVSTRQAPLVGAPNGTTTSDSSEYATFTYFPTYVMAWFLVALILSFLFGMAIHQTMQLQIPPKLMTIEASMKKKRK